MLEFVCLPDELEYRLDIIERLEDAGPGVPPLIFSNVSNTLFGVVNGRAALELDLDT